MSVRQHPTKAGHWQIWISHGRKQKPDVLVFEGTRLEAEAVEAELRGIPKHGKARLVDVIGRFLENYEVERMASTVKACKLAFETRLLPYYGDKYIALLTTADHDRYKAKRLADGVSKRTISIELLYFRACLNFAKQEGYDIGVLPKPFPKRDTKAKIPDVLTPAELSAILEQLPPVKRAMVMLMGKCGLRKGEVSKITAADIDEGVIVVTGKGDKQRVIPMPEGVAKCAISIAEQFEAKWLEENKEAEDKTAWRNLPLFPVKDIRKSLESAAKRAGITKHVHPHMFRHTAGTVAVAAGVQQRVIQEFLGHSDIRTTDVYTHIAAKNLKYAVEQMSQMYQTEKPRHSSNSGTSCE